MLHVHPITLLLQGFRVATLLLQLMLDPDHKTDATQSFMFDMNDSPDAWHLLSPLIGDNTHQDPQLMLG